MIHCWRFFWNLAPRSPAFLISLWCLAVIDAAAMPRLKPDPVYVEKLQDIVGMGMLRCGSAAQSFFPHIITYTYTITINYKSFERSRIFSVLSDQGLAFSFICLDRTCTPPCLRRKISRTKDSMILASKRVWCLHLFPKPLRRIRRDQQSEFRSEHEVLLSSKLIESSWIPVIHFCDPKPLAGPSDLQFHQRAFQRQLLQSSGR